MSETSADFVEISRSLASLYALSATQPALVPRIRQGLNDIICAINKSKDRVGGQVGVRKLDSKKRYERLCKGAPKGKVRLLRDLVETLGQKYPKLKNLPPPVKQQDLFPVLDSDPALHDEFFDCFERALRQEPGNQE